MSNLLEGKLALVTGIANRWSLAYAVAQAFAREGATLVLTYLGERQKDAIEDLSKVMNVAAILPCDVTKDEELAALTESLRGLGRPLHAVLHSLAFANREDLSRPFVETPRSGFLLAQDVSIAAACVNAVVTVKLTQQEFDALVDFVFNLGAGAFKGSTMLRNLNAGNFTSAAAQFDLWDRAGGAVVAGLLRRRQAEAALFDTSDASAESA